MLSTLAPKPRLQPGQTLLVGIVTNNKDPKGWGRVKVRLPTLVELEESESNWARVVGLGAANHRGFYCLPEINDEVLVGFEHGDIHRPYIIGGVWNGRDRTVEPVENTIENGKVRLRTIKTRTGHMIQFVEEDGIGSENGMGAKAGIHIKTTGGHHVHLCDSFSDKGIKIQTSGGHHVNLNDSPQKSIDIRTVAGQYLTLNDEGMTVTLHANNIINIDAGTDVNIHANGAVTVSAMDAATVSAMGAVTIDALEAVNILSPQQMNLMSPNIKMVGMMEVIGDITLDGLQVIAL